jgi:hypothetical protein
MARFEIGDEFSVLEKDTIKYNKFKKLIEKIKKEQADEIKNFEEKEERLEEEIKELEKVLSATADETEREEIRDRIKAIKGIIGRGVNNTITFYQTRDYKYNFSPNTRIKYKEVIDKIDRMSGRPIYKSHYINVIAGRIKTASAEEIAFLDIHNGYKRDSERELTPIEKERKALDDIKKEKEAYETKILDMKRVLEKGQEFIAKPKAEKKNVKTK